MTQPAPILDTEHARFMLSGVSISLASCDAQNVPTVVRALGCRISADRRQVTVFTSGRQAGAALDCLRERGAIAVVFSKPSTLRTVQIKGKDARIEGLLAGDIELMAAYQAAFTRELEIIGHPPVKGARLFRQPAEDIVAVTFTPSAAFSQTPGPHAGEPLQSPQ